MLNLSKITYNNKRNGSPRSLILGFCNDLHRLNASGVWFRLLIFFFFIVFFNACKKEKPPSTPGVIAGPKNLCPKDSGITYSIAPVEGSSFYLWTVPDDAKIISGQGSTSIIIQFGNISGSICVRSNNDKEYSDASCIEVTRCGVSNTWCREMNFKGGGRSQGVAFSILDKGYIGIGLDKLGNRHQDFWEYDPAYNLWTQKEDFPGGPRLNAVGFAIGNKGYIGTGDDGSTLFHKDFWEYDPISGHWTQKADCSDSVRHFAFGFSIGNKGYIGSGSYDVITIMQDFWEYDPSIDQWVQKASTMQRNGGTGFSIGNKGYFGLGSKLNINFNDFWEFDPADFSNGHDINNNPIGKWTQKATFPGLKRYVAVGFSIGSSGYLGMGYDGNDNYNDFYEYDPVLDQWDQKAYLSGSRGYPVGFSIGNNGYVGLGTRGEEYLSDFWVYGK